MTAENLALRLQTLFPEGLSGLIFDCDGVLTDSCAANIKYFDTLLEAAGLPRVAPDQVEYVQMATGRQAVEYLFPPDRHAELPALVERFPYRTITFPLLQPEPGLVEMIHWLHGQGVRLGVHTNRGQGMWDLLEKFELKAFFAPVMTVQNAIPKPSPDGVFQILADWKLPPARVAFIGDSQTDVEAARGGGVTLLAYRNQALPAAACIADFEELRSALAVLPGLGAKHP